MVVCDEGSTSFFVVDVLGAVAEASCSLYFLWHHRKLRVKNVVHNSKAGEMKIKRHC